MANHTPGPWHAVRANEDRFYIDGQGAPVLAWVFGDLPEFRGGKMEANADLIAAAPEMYEALKRCIVALEALYPSGERIELEYEDEQRAIASLLDYCRAALAKADGKQASE